MTRLRAALRRAGRACAGIALAGATAWLVVRWGALAPPDPRAALLERFAVTRVLDRQGRVLQALTAEGHARHRPLRLPDVSPHLLWATIAAEDQRFWQHPGVDGRAVLRALGQNLRQGRVVSGASTITQQVCKWIAPRDRSIAAKLREAGAAVGVEGALTKPEILELYLEFAPYGGLHRGAEQAARAWLGKPAADLSLAEAAWLAVLPRSPARLDPGRDPAAALPAQRRLVERMWALGWIDAEQRRTALAQPIRIAPDATRLRAPHLVESMASTLGPAVSGRPVAIRTPIDGVLQREVESIARRHVEALRDRGVGNAAVVVLDNDTAEVRALVGSVQYGDAAHGGANNGAVALRQPGSALKPFVYARAFESALSPASVLPDLPAHYRTAQGVWTPGNYGGRFRGPVRARVALASSLNLPAVALTDQVGVPSVLRDLQAAGLDSLRANPTHYGLGLALGDGEVRLLDLTAAYAVFVRGGLWRPPVVWTSVLHRDGAVTAIDRGAARRVYSAPTAWQIADVLSDSEARAPAFGRGGPLELPFWALAKTGTSKGFRDNWAFGATLRWTVGVWVGNFDGAPMRQVSGATGAAPILRDVLLNLHPDRRSAPPDRPAGLQAARVCALSGLGATAACGPGVVQWLRPDQHPPQCDWHQHRDGRAVTVLPAQYRVWATEASVADRPQDEPARGPGAALAIDSPMEGARLVVDPAVDRAAQQLGLRARAADGRWRLRWQVDQRVIAEAAPANAPVLWPIVAGLHEAQLQALDGAGRVAATASVRFEVVEPRRLSRR
ncbi:MAG: penicillin-binding protein 1C [Deltaproteobacteria bacterium]|nr:penicillin-binding protein 1C [Deltaproteobacteria bacterium]